ncbi:MAG: sulfite exporter TauE/SafE family protein [Candidatus Muirbacterium halophilum]|nr:sulfite exporter TauE/SafE family protein [Candidatus Muirbacterium halophilum]
MTITLGIFITVFFLAFFCEYIDSAFGMGYGTILTPVLLIMGFTPAVVVPAILLSQATGGFAASIFHHKLDNLEISKTSKDFKISVLISLTGIFATVFAAVVAINISPIFLKTYIGILVISMGLILLTKMKFKFSWNRMLILSLVSSFNKGISGGGFGPLITAGQVVSGQKVKNAVGVTVFTEIPICLTGAFTYFFMNAMRSFDGSIMKTPFNEFIFAFFAKNYFSWELILALCLGSIIVAPFGALTTSIFEEKDFRKILGIIITLLGSYMLIKTYM